MAESSFMWCPCMQKDNPAGPLVVYCSRCDGEGSVPEGVRGRDICPECKGGCIQPCPRCDGKGKIYADDPEPEEAPSAMAAPPTVALVLGYEPQRLRKWLDARGMAGSSLEDGAKAILNRVLDKGCDGVVWIES